MNRSWTVAKVLSGYFQVEVIAVIGSMIWPFQFSCGIGWPSEASKMSWSISSISSSSNDGGCGPRTVFWEAVSGMMIALLFSRIRVAVSSLTRYFGACGDFQALRMVLWMFIY